MRLQCAGCGVRERVSFRIWWHYRVHGIFAWLHLPCWVEYQEQKRIDGI